MTIKWSHPEDRCPGCNVDLDAGQLPEELWPHAVPPYRWSRKIAITNVDPAKWRCPDCGHEWDQ